MTDGTKYNLLSIFRISLKVYPIYLVVSCMIVILNGIFEPTNLVIMKKFIDQVLDVVQQNAGFGQLIPLFAFILILQFYKYFIPALEKLLATKFSHKVKKYFLTLVLDKISRLEYQHIENKGTYDLIHRVKKSAEENIKESLYHLAKIVSGVISVLGLLMVIWQAGWWISLALLLTIGMTTFLAYKCGTRTFAVSVAYSRIERENEYYESIFTDRSIASELKLFRGSEYIKKLFVDTFEETIKKFFATEIRNRTNYEVVLGLIGYLLLFATYIILLYPLANQVITIGFYIATINAVSRLVTFITKSLPQSLQYLFESQLYWKEVGTFFALSEKYNQVATSKQVQNFKEIKFNNVHFKYPNSNQYILKGVSFTLERGKHYAIVGKNGAGKSTITKLLTGLYDVDQGQITIDRANINDFSADELSKFFSVVFQDFGRYKVSVLDNYRLTNIYVKPDLARMSSIAHKLDFLDTIQKMPQGYNTVLGKLTADGIDLSGGEWQKLALCRSIYSSAALRILDEPTASLDPVAETKLYQLFEDTLTKDSSTIFISHRLGSTKLADEIILIDDGMVKEKGSHHELMKKNGLYKRMFDSQKGWYRSEG